MYPLVKLQHTAEFMRATVYEKGTKINMSSSDRGNHYLNESLSHPSLHDNLLGTSS